MGAARSNVLMLTTHQIRSYAYYAGSKCGRASGRSVEWTCLQESGKAKSRQSTAARFARYIACGSRHAFATSSTTWACSLKEQYKDASTIETTICHVLVLVIGKLPDERDRQPRVDGLSFSLFLS